MDPSNAGQRDLADFITHNWKWLLPLLLLLLLLLWLLLRSLFKKKNDTSLNLDSGSDSDSDTGSDSDSSDDGDQWGDEGDEGPPRPTPSEVAKNAQEIKQILSGDPVVAQLLAERFGEQASQLAGNNPRIQQIAARIVPYDLELYRLASKQKLLKFNVEARSELEKAIYPTSDIDILPVTDPTDIESVMPESFLLPQPEFARQLVSSELLGMNFYEKITRAKILYIIRDISGSMEELLRSGFPKHVFARGVIVNLLINAQRDGGKFFYRDFDDYAHELVMVETKDQMETLAKKLLEFNIKGGGTNIPSAIQTAVDDIRTRGGDFASAELLVISDGQDNTITTEWLKNCLGDDISLHFVALGGRDEAGGAALQEVAKTFVEYN